MKGIILAGGEGTRLDPLTKVTSKQLIPVYDKPMVYYPLSILMLAGIQEILVISSPRYIEDYKILLGDGKSWGLSFTYCIQDQPRGLADAFVVGKDFIGADSVCLVLGDNLIFGQGLPNVLTKCAQLDEGAVIFAYLVQDPQRYGVVEFDRDGKVLSLEEKPAQPKSNYAVPGIYFFDQRAVEYSENLKPSARGEIEITDLIRIYLDQGKLDVEVIGRGVAWLDAGTHQSLLQASNFVQAVQDRQGLMISSPEEIAFRKGYIDEEQFKTLVAAMVENSYRRNLERLLT